MNKRSLIVIAVVAVLVVASMAVAMTYLNKGSAKTEVAGDISIVDDRGKTVNFTAAPERIVSMGSSFTDIIVSLGGADKIVGVDYSSASVSGINANTTNLGKVSTLSMDSLLNLDPDVVIMWNFPSYQAAISNMEGNNISVVALYPKNVTSAMNTMDQLGKLIGKDATNLVDGLQSRMNNVTEKTRGLAADQQVSIYIELASYGGQTATNGTLTNELIEMAGGRNIFANGTGNWKASTEWIVAEDPSIIVIENSSIRTNQDLINALGPSVSAVPDHIYRIDAGTLTISPKMVDALEDLAYWLHPDLFPELAPQ
jgi:iron complex transport system substrate-binding protein